MLSTLERIDPHSDRIDVLVGLVDRLRPSLGTMGLIGFLLGVPLDIRHAANFSTAMVALDYQAGWELASLSVAGFLAIGVMSRLVSFGQTRGNK